MAEWPLRELGELTANHDSRRVPVKEPDRRHGPYPYYGASGIVDHVDGHIFDGEFLLIAEDGENLRTRNTPVAFLADGKFWVNNHAHIVQGNSASDTRYLMYALSITDISGYLTGSTIPKLTQGSLNRIRVPAPPLAAQRAIAHVLGGLDDKVRLNHRLIGTLEAMARALFKSWFGDFAPVEESGEVEGTDLEGSGVDDFPHSLAPVDLKAMPQGWEVGALGNIARQRRELVDPRRAPDHTFHHFSLPAYDNGKRPEVQQGSEIKSVKYGVPPRSVLVSKLNPRTPRVWLADPDSGANCIASTEFLVLEPVPPVTREYLYFLAQSPDFLGQLQSLATGTSGSHQRARPEAVLALSVLRPPPRVLAAFARVAAPLLDRALVAQRECWTLSSIRDALLPKLMSGELMVPDAERMAVEAGV